MSSMRRILSSRANGARSHGPKTPAGKAASAKNALRHGLLANCIVLQNESPAAFESLLNDHVARLCPEDGVELGLVEDLAAALSRCKAQALRRLLRTIRPGALVGLSRP